MILVYPDKHAVPELPPAIRSFPVDRVIGGASLHAALPYGVRERYGGRDEKCVVIRCPHIWELLQGGILAYEGLQGKALVIGGKGHRNAAGLQPLSLKTIVSQKKE